MKGGVAVLGACCLVHLGILAAVVAAPVPVLAAAAVLVAAAGLVWRRRGSRADGC